MAATFLMFDSTDCDPATQRSTTPVDLTHLKNQNIQTPFSYRDTNHREICVAVSPSDSGVDITIMGETRRFAHKCTGETLGTCDLK